MDLATAIKKVAPFARGLGALSGVRIAPAIWHSDPVDNVVDGVLSPVNFGYVMATDGKVGVIALLDPAVAAPNVVIDAKALQSSLSAIKKENFSIRPLTRTSVQIATATGATYQLLAHDVADFPPLPSFPTTLRSVPCWEAVQRVVHAAGGDNDRPELGCLRIAADCVEATDQFRTARSATALVERGAFLVTKELFQKWPKSKKARQNVAFAVHAGHAFVYVDGCLRFAPTSDDGKLPDLAGMVPESFGGQYTHVVTKVLTGAVKHAINASPSDLVRLSIGGTSVQVAALDDQGAATFEDTIACEPCPNVDPVSLVLRGRLLWSSLSALDHDVVALGYSDTTAPLRLEVPGYAEMLCPLFPSEVDDRAS